MFTAQSLKEGEVEFTNSHVLGFLQEDTLKCFAESRVLTSFL